ncbi:MAG: hypothetical protein Q4A16_07375 [Lautropia sp.]|nr:hypothetical protein [Lautropia sp.]
MDTQHNDAGTLAFRLTGWLTLGLIGVLMAACTALPERTRPQRTTPSTTLPGKPAAPSIADFSGHCQQKEIDGFTEDARLQISGGQVQMLDWSIKVGRKGQCRFDLADFRQTRNSPHIELQAVSAGQRSSCKLLVYGEPRRLTLAHRGCDAFCSKKGLSEEAWPVMFNPTTGRCASLDR